MNVVNTTIVENSDIPEVLELLNFLLPILCSDFGPSQAEISTFFLLNFSVHFIKVFLLLLGVAGNPDPRPRELGQLLIPHEISDLKDF